MITGEKPGVLMLKLKAQEHAVRLVGGGTTNFQGRVELMLRGTWGRVCGFRWDLQDANVVCRQLGYERAVAVPKYSGFGSGKGKIWMDNVQCRGNESSLFECKHDRWGGFRCNAYEEARAVCKPAARLVERTSVGEGLVQVYYNNTWGWVCADQWDRYDADVVCQMMGFNGSSFVSWGSAVIEQQNDQIWMSNVRCTGNEDSIFSCAHDGLGSNNCANKRKAYVRCNDSKGVRLVGGGTIVSHGRIEVFHDGVWGTVCRYFRDKEHANVVCRQLGYGGGLIVPSSAAFGPGKGVIWMSRLRCNGDEKSITACGHEGWGVTYGNHHNDASVICTPTVRLVEGQTAMEGLVQVYYNNTWGWVGADRWDKQDADVVCRMLGISGSTSLLHASNSGNYTIWMNNVQCTGQESSLFSCVHDVWGSHLGANSHKAGVVCKGQGVRLVDGGTIESQGRIEVFQRGIWGQICRSNSDSQREAQVVCRQLGYEGAEQALDGIPFGAEVIALMKDVRCAGNESLLQECEHNKASGIGYRCSHSYVASAICTPLVRLVNGRSVKEGFVQVYYNNTWGWICDKQWGKNDADVVCRMLSYEGSSSAVHRSAYCGQEQEITWVSNVRCSGNESSLFSCAHDGWENHHCSGRCAISRKAGVVCKDPKVRLVGGYSSFEGRVEVLHAGIWGKVMTGHSWYLKNNAIVVCRQLGYEHGVSTIDSRFGQAARNTWMGYLECRGNEKSIIECRHRQESRWYHNDLKVMCTPAARLVNGTSAMEGLVQVYYNNSWGTMCNEQRDKREADVVCRMMGYDGYSTVVVKSVDSYQQHYDAAWMTNLQCTGNESTLFSCNHDGWRLGKCVNGENAIVACKRSEVRLVGGNHRWEGSVQVLYLGSWGAVCDNGWDIHDANVVCHQLGFKGAEAAPLRSAFGSRSGKRWMDEVKCRGNESSISECLHNGWGINGCSYSSLASVVCNRQLVPTKATTSPFVMLYCPPSPFVCKQETNCTLICLVSGTAAVGYNWTKDGKPIDYDDIIISNNVLVVNPHVKEDYGVFMCKAFNMAGSAASCRIALEDEDGGRGIPFLPITIALSCVLLIAIAVTCYLIKWRRQHVMLNPKTTHSPTTVPHTKQETRNDPQAPGKATHLELLAKTTQEQEPLEHEYQPLRHRSNDSPEYYNVPKYYNVEYNFGKREQTGDAYEEVELAHTRRRMPLGHQL